MKNIIFLQKIGQVEDWILRKLKRNLEWALKEYEIHVEILHDEIPLTDNEYVLHERKYNAELIMNNLFTRVKDINNFRTLGVLDRDIYVHGLNFIFGTARNPVGDIFISPVALISVTRLRESFYGNPEDIAKFELRVLKEAVHELGHTFGLKHCSNECIMRFSNWLGDTDEKPPHFCTSCLKQVKIFFNNIS